MMRRQAQLLFSAALLFAFAVSAQADPVIYEARHDPTPGFESRFTFDFGGGFTETAFISNTAFVLRVDEQVLPQGDARFLSYFQNIDPLNLPDPTGGSTPISTGAITVEILPGSHGTGTYNSATGAFSTSEVYRVYYTGDLSAYGLTEGFVDLPSTSQGTISFDHGVGRIQQRWEGTYTFPGTTVSLTYQCQTNALIIPEPASVSVLGMALGLWFIRRWLPTVA